jgi:hypothetical protein
LASNDLLARRADRVEVGPLDVAPVAQVVAHQERCRLLAARGAARFDQPRQAVATIEPGPEDDLPEAAQRLLYRHQQGAFDTHRVVVARR